MSTKTERRYVDIAVRQSSEGKLVGYAALFGVRSQDLGGFYEELAPGCFSRCLRTHPDIVCLFNHNNDKVLGRTTAGTLEVREDTKGLWFSCEVAPTTVGKDVYESVKRGDLSQCSFGFICNDQEWKRVPGVGDVRIVLDADVFDVSVVTRPAYLATSVDARTFFPQGMPAEIRKMWNGEPVNGIYRPRFDNDNDFITWARLKLKLVELD